MTVVGVAGMTHLGLVSASAIASKGFQTICYDSDEALTRQLEEGVLPVSEPDLAQLIRENGSSQTFSCRLSDLSACDVVYIAPDIPTDDLGASDTEAIRGLIDQVVTHLKSDAVMVVLSQVEPGFTRALPAPEPERLFYQVETLVFGKAVERATLPERFIVGCVTPEKLLPQHLASVLEAFNCPILQMRYESAELTKISINFCLVSSISVANTLAEVCERIGADWSEIVPALKLDRRIGQHAYLKPGLGIAGGNLERDLATIERIGELNNTDTRVVSAWKQNSLYRRNWAVRTIHSAILDSNVDATIAVWGLAYKENTHSVKNSPSLATIAQLPEAHLQLHDPVVSGKDVGHARAKECPDPISALSGADALMILTPWPQYGQIDAKVIANTLKGRILLDPYQVIGEKAAVEAGLDYRTLGKASFKPY